MSTLDIYSRLSTFLLLTLDIFTLDSRLFSLDSRLLLSTLDFYSRLSTITLDSRHLLSTLDPRLLDTLGISKSIFVTSILTCKENFIINLFEYIVCCPITFLYYKRNRKTRLVRLWCDNALGKC